MYKVNMHYMQIKICRNMHLYAKICSTICAEICKNVQMRKMQYIIISSNMLKYAKGKYAHNMQNNHGHKIKIYAQICKTKYAGLSRDE